MFYLGPWVWVDEPGISGRGVGWDAPAGAIPVIDLRSLPMMEQAGGPPLGFAVFEAPAGSLPSEYMALGDTPETQLRTGQRDAWVTRVGFASPMEARTITEAVWESLTWRADPTGQDNAKPLIPTTRRQLELHVAGSVKRVPFSPTMREFNGIQAVLQNDYRTIRAAVLNSPHRPANERMPPGHYRKVLGAWERKYGIDDMRVFIPNDLPLEKPRRPTTTIIEGFNGANKSDVGYDHTWTKLRGLSDNFSSTLRQLTQAVNGDRVGLRCEVDLSSSDHYVELEIVLKDAANIIYTGPTCRKDNTATDTHYKTQFTGKAGSDNDQWRTSKRVAGALTTLGTTAGLEGVVGDTVRIDLDGSTWKRFRNGAQQQSGTDTAISGGLRCGFAGVGWTSTPKPQWDNFEASDGLEPPALGGIILLRRRRRSR